MFNTNRPDIKDFLESYKAGIRGVKDQRADLNEGSLYEQIGGVSAIIWSRMAQRDQNLFEATQTVSATDSDLTTRIQKIFGINRILEQPGTGQIIASRPNAGAGGDTFFAGTRIEVVANDGLSEPIPFEVSEDTLVPSAALQMVIPIVAVNIGPSIESKIGETSVPRFVDAIWDPTWSIQVLTCSAGVNFEPAPALRTRARTSRINERTGRLRKIQDVCMAAGASQVVLFPSNFGGDDIDFGLNWVYVGDDSFNCNESLRAACVLALEDARTLGDNLQVGKMVSTDLIINANVYIVDSPAKYNTASVIQRLRNYLISTIKSDYTFSLDALAGAMYQASPIVQNVVFNTPTTDSPLLTTSNGVLNFPATLSRYNLKSDNITLTLFGPQA